MKEPGEKLFESLRDNVGPNVSIYEKWEDCPKSLKEKFATAERKLLIK